MHITKKDYQFLLDEIAFVREGNQELTSRVNKLSVENVELTKKVLLLETIAKSPSTTASGSVPQEAAEHFSPELLARINAASGTSINPPSGGLPNRWCMGTAGSMPDQDCIEIGTHYGHLLRERAERYQVNVQDSRFTKPVKDVRADLL